MVLFIVFVQPWQCSGVSRALAKSSACKYNHFHLSLCVAGDLNSFPFFFLCPSLCFDQRFSLCTADWPCSVLPVLCVCACAHGHPPRPRRFLTLWWMNVTHGSCTFFLSNAHFFCTNKHRPQYWERLIQATYSNGDPHNLAQRLAEVLTCKKKNKKEENAESFIIRLNICTLMCPDYLRLMSLTQTNRSTRRTHTVIRSELEGGSVLSVFISQGLAPSLGTICRVCVCVCDCERVWVFICRMRKTNTPSHYAPVFCVILHPIFLQYFSVFFCAAAVCQQRAVPTFYCMGIFFFFVCKGEKPMSWCRWVWADLADPVKSLMVAHLLFLFNLPSLSAGRSVQHSGGQEWRETSVLFPNYFISYYHKATCWLQIFFFCKILLMRRRN